MEQDATTAGQGSVDKSFDEVHRQLLSDSSIQFDLPKWSPPKPPKWAEPLADFLQWIAPYLIYFFWGAVILGVALILALIFMEMGGVKWKMPWHRAAPEEQEPEVWRPDATVAQILLSEADDLAAKGRFEEAVHLLLHRSVADIAQRLPDFLRPSLTARDIAASPVLPAQPRSAFDRMRDIVEAGVFARQPVGSDEWREARQAYERFAFGGAWA